MLPNHKAIFEAEQQRLFNSRSLKKRMQVPDDKQKATAPPGFYYSSIAKKFVPFGWRPSKNKPAKTTTGTLKEN